ncbi:DUF6653 family protein [Pseudoalteromonas viridis]|uniref:Uncharacterized protein n=1 Tax=Pseudoalteromonas viridis TaxID=339617 RepID=A0ABX7V5Z3_9GAMM|nr:DUF6653 family protein [Pseudoalteromonas viridis]QTL36308.1 hypothetical protein J5X90_04455 [Pseudoalteromonas viridis]
MMQRTAAKYFAMSEEVWARHANPWSVWSRYSCLPLLIACLWWRDWLGMAFWPVLVVLLLWVWLNPRCFSKPRDTHNWASQAVLGEQILIYQLERVPLVHYQVIKVIITVLSVSTLVCAAGLWFQEAISTSVGALGVILSKTWFLDRMVWLYQSVTSSSIEIAARQAKT